jgi:uncharacterized protein (DUF362 family)
MNETHAKSRREFLKNIAVGAVAAKVGLLAAMEAGSSESAEGKSTVVIARDEQLYGTSAKPEASRVEKLLDRAMQTFYRSDDPVTPWKKLVRPGEVVGLKVNTIGGPGLSTHIVLVEAICERLQQAGVKANNIVVWDRTNRELDRVGYKITNTGNGVRTVGTDSKEVEYEETASEFGVVKTRLSKLLTRTCDCMINVPLPKDHDLAGVTMALKNMYGVNHNPQDLHENNCCPYIADLNMIPAIKNKFRLVIADAMMACYQGGPMFSPEYTWKYNAVMVASDPVAIDRTAWQIIEKKRAEQGMKPLAEVGRPAKYLAVAADAQHRLGTDDPKRIRLIEV